MVVNSIVLKRRRNFTTFENKLWLVVLKRLSSSGHSKFLVVIIQYSAGIVRVIFIK